MKRNEALDALKGMAIVLVVMGHVIAGCFPNGASESSYLFSLIYSFHMPLFLCVSGVLCGMGSKRSVGAYVCHRIMTLLVPWLVANVMIRCYYSGLDWVHGPDPFAKGPTGYWYLQVLFIYSVSFMLMTVLTDRIKRVGFRALLEVLIVVLSWWLLVNYGRWYYRLQFSVSPLFANFEYWQVRRRLLWFALGFFVSRYDLWRFVINRWMHAVSILLFVPLAGCFCAVRGGTVCGGIVGIMACLNVFYDKDFRCGRAFQWCKKVGMYTMQIYVLHYLFLPYFPEFGKWINSMNASYGRVSTLAFEMAYSGVLTAIVIVACVILAKMIGTSRVASRLLFGGR